MHQGIKTVGQQHGVGAGFRQVGGRTHGNADVGSRQHRHIVDPVAEHQHLATFLVQLLQNLQFVVRTQSTPSFINAELGGDTGDHRRTVARKQQRTPATRLARRQQCGGVGTQAVIENEPREWPVAIAEQQPLTGFVRHRWFVGATEFADKTGLADTQALPVHQAFEAQSRCAVDFFGGRWRAAERTGNRVF
ncbi:hypothetical protein D3C84_761470 [compost metagenome]